MPRIDVYVNVNYEAKTPMNALETQLHYPLGDALPAAGRCIEVAPGIKWIRMALPFALDHINLWLLRDRMDTDGGLREGWSVVDCCISRPEAKAQWEEVFAHELEGLPILRVIATHMHPDHIGLADWLCQRWNADLWISAADYQVARHAVMGANGFGGERSAAFFAAHGMTDPGSVDQVRGRTNYFPNLVPSMPESYRRLMDGTELDIGGRTWRCISGYGHAPEHIALYCEQLHILIGGDMMLPRISTNVSVYEQEPLANALRLFLDSIDKFKPLPEDTLTLPAHGKPFLGLHIRIAQLHDHHRERLDDLLLACTAKPLSAFDAVPVLFKRALDLHQMTFAMGESVAHLHALWFAKKLQRSLDSDGVYRFSAIA
jgi:glyoxylase-like metal-dependent hydrolase (beta-lactamase superfamily II)